MTLRNPSVKYCAPRTLRESFFQESGAVVLGTGEFPLNGSDAKRVSPTIARPFAAHFFFGS
jgi:hypothetical protein